jgi:N-acyl-D-aspartate/D-glutamate deacylase
MNDLLIRGARIYDGSGGPPRDGDVAVAGGRIAAIGRNLGAAATTIDAGGLALAPGIIDPHTHYDAQITWDPSARPSVELGVTTVAIGNCGFTIAPCRPRDRERTLANLTQVEGMPLAALQAGTRWEFETYPEYLGFLERQGLVPNVASYCGHSALRTFVMGEEASARRATADEIGAMCALLREALVAGAFGFGTSTFEGHNGAGGTPMPSRVADDDEMRALNRTLGEAGHGHFMLTKGAHTSMEHLESLAAESGRPLFVAALLDDNMNPGRALGELELIRAAQARGHRLYGMVTCSPMTMDFTLASAYPFEILAAWTPAISLYRDPARLHALYRDPSFRAAVRDALGRGIEKREYTPQWDKLEIVEVARVEHRDYEGRSVAELAREAGRDPLDWFLDFGLDEGCKTQFSMDCLNADESSVLALLKHPYSTVALSDAGAHLTLFCDAGFGLYLFGRWVRELGAFTLEEAVAKITGHHARAFGIRDRGLIEPGYWADLLLFDPATVGRGPKQRVRDLPGGSHRLTTPSRGVHGVFVNGVRTVTEQGSVIEGVQPGHLLRRFDA